MESPRDAKLLAEVSGLISAIPAADYPDWASKEVTGWAMDRLDTSELACRLYGLWSGLQDWYELRDDTADSLEAIRQAAVDWSDVSDVPEQRAEYFDRWSTTVRAAFLREASPAHLGLDKVVGALMGSVVEYDEGAGVGFIRADVGGPTWAFRWDEIRIDAHFKTTAVGTRVLFEGRKNEAQERSAFDVRPA